MHKQGVITYKLLLLPPSLCGFGWSYFKLPVLCASRAVEEGYICFCICCALDLESFDK